MDTVCGRRFTEATIKVSHLIERSVSVTSSEAPDRCVPV